MAQFKDNKGRSWLVDVNVSSIKRVKSALCVDLASLVEADGKLIERLMSDPILLVDVVYVICKPDADKLGITDEEFGAAMAGDAIDGATTALLESLTLFFRSPKVRAIMDQIIKAINKAQDKAADLAQASLDKDLDNIISNALTQAMSGRSSIKPPESAA